MNYRHRSVVFFQLTVLSLVMVMTGCSGKNPRDEAVATMNGDTITVGELREFLGIRGKGANASGIPLERKKEALERLIGGRLLAAQARTLGLDNTEEFREGVKRNKEGVLITALFRKQFAGTELPADMIDAEAKKLRAADNTLSEKNARERAEKVVIQKELRKAEMELISSARMEFPPDVDNTLIRKIGSGEEVADDSVLAKVDGELVTYGEVKGLLAGMMGMMQRGQAVYRDPVAISRMLDREVTGKALAAYARKQGIEGSEWMRQIQTDMERSILIDLIAEREILTDIRINDKEVKASYEQHAKMFVRDGKKIPMKEVDGQIRKFLENEKRKKALEDYIAELKRKTKVTLHESVLSKV